jgi:pimeloyl-ACP methyl ester carboxylesterase
MLILILILLIFYYYIIYQNGIIINSNKFFRNNILKNYKKYKYKIHINNNEYIIFWYYKSNKNNNNKTILYFFGYLESYSLNFTPNKINLFTNNLYNLDFIIFDYRGIGESKGKYNEKNMLNDGLYIIDYLLNNKKFNLNINNLILYGYSIGSISVLFLNKILVQNNLKPNKIILEAPLYTFSLNNLFNKLIKYFINYDLNFNILENLKYIKSPILILHGNKDTIISYNQSKDIIQLLIKLNKLNKKKINIQYLFLQNAGHNNLLKFKKTQSILFNFIKN